MLQSQPVSYLPKGEKSSPFGMTIYIVNFFGHMAFDYNLDIEKNDNHLIVLI